MDLAGSPAAEVVTVAATLLSAGFAGWAAFAAARAASAATKQLISDQRAWISIYPSISELRFYATGADFQIEIDVKNEGKTPALDVHTSVEIFPKQLNDEVDFIRKFAKKSAKESYLGSKRLVLPGEKYIRGWNLSIDNLEKGGINTYLYRFIICTSYRIPHDNNIHQTVCAYWAHFDEDGNVINYREPKNNVVRAEVVGGGFAT
ncbi:hypothetical protein [Ancylobacter sp. SL191]|uniref:hypothetical protein n=1 Tax=Ancylobacter sp. SL191 TaxID=2995166 RepID=UPI0022705852|nr:hypothetical protein [Ancylobacter sp. SL191]WAC26276.1 hypothetical protein OU996_14810 [Ancylobacter sp. SL191]